MSTTINDELDEAALGEFMHQFITDLAAAHHAVTVASVTGSGCTARWPKPDPATEREVAAAAGMRRALHT